MGLRHDLFEMGFGSGAEGAPSDHLPARATGCCVSVTAAVCLCHLEIPAPAVSDHGGWPEDHMQEEVYTLPPMKRRLGRRVEEGKKRS